MTPELYKQLVAQTEQICREEGIEIQSEEDLNFYVFTLFGIAPIEIELESEPFNEEELDLKQQFKNLGL